MVFQLKKRLLVYIEVAAVHGKTCCYFIKFFLEKLENFCDMHKIIKEKLCPLNEIKNKLFTKF